MQTRQLKVLAISDIHSPDSFFISELNNAKLDLIVTLGDISPEIIDYILMMAGNIPVIGVLGNHDPEEMPGLESLHLRTQEYLGYIWGGFNGAKKYKNRPNHFDEKYVVKKIKKMPSVDVFISHAPPFCVSMEEDFIHQGFRAFDDYIAKKRPKYWLHGHIGKYYSIKIKDTTVIGIDGKRFITL